MSARAARALTATLNPRSRDRGFVPFVFYLGYLHDEPVRRRTRTVVTLVGLGVGVALVIALASLSNGLDRAQKRTLDPLGPKIGGDIIELLAGLAAEHGATVVGATHDAGLAERAPRRVAARDGGLAVALLR